MKVFLSGIESSEKTIVDEYIKDRKKIDYCLTSFYYLRKKETLKNKLFDFASDMDCSALYPSITEAFNIAVESMDVKLFISFLIGEIFLPIKSKTGLVILFVLSRILFKSESAYF